ncbi:sel1 repeat family protein [Pelomyxa schiedti]|nr:sel1 repeat family protein [Pelomyxa schiedti]
MVSPVLNVKNPVWLQDGGKKEFEFTCKEIPVCPHKNPPDNLCKYCWKSLTQAVKSIMHNSLMHKYELFITARKPGAEYFPLCRVSQLNEIVCRLGRRPNKCKQQRILAEPERYSGMCAEQFDVSTTTRNGGGCPTKNSPDSPETVNDTEGEISNTRDKIIESWWMHCATTYHKQELLASNIFLYGGAIQSRLWNSPETNGNDESLVHPQLPLNTKPRKSHSPVISPETNETSALQPWGLTDGTAGTSSEISQKPSRLSPSPTSSSEDEKINTPASKRQCLTLQSSTDRELAANAILSQPGVQILWQNANDKTVVIACWKDSGASVPLHQWPLACIAPTCEIPQYISAPSGTLLSFLQTALRHINDGQMSHATYTLRLAVGIAPRSLAALALLNWCWWSRPESEGEDVAQVKSGEETAVFDAPSNDMAIELLRNATTEEQNSAEAFFTAHCDIPASRSVLATLVLYLRRDARLATQLWASAAEQNCAPAQRSVAVRHIRGDSSGVCGCDPMEGVRLLRLAAMRGDVPAYGWLAHCYELGIGLPQNWKKAEKYYRLASERGDLESQCGLGWLYERGLGVSHTNFGKAVMWYHRSAAQGFADAQRRLAWLQWVGLGTPRNRPQAVKNLLKAAKQGHVQSLTELQLWLLSLKGKLAMSLPNQSLSATALPVRHPMSAPISEAATSMGSPLAFGYKPFPLESGHSPQQLPLEPSFPVLTGHSTTPNTPRILPSVQTPLAEFHSGTAFLFQPPISGPSTIQTQIQILSASPTVPGEIPPELISASEEWLTCTVSSSTLLSTFSQRQADLSRRYFWSKDNSPPII